MTDTTTTDDRYEVTIIESAAHPERGSDVTNEEAAALMPARYDVAFDDCCVSGGFRARLIEMRFDERENDYVDALVFDNGVTLTKLLAVRVVAVPA